MKVNFPTSRDIYLEANGRKLAVVEGYRARSTRENRVVEAFGEAQPVGVLTGRERHVVTLSRVCACESAVSDGVSFYGLSGFNLCVVKPDKRIVYAGCEWVDIEESAGLNDTVLENVTITALRRLELSPGEN